MRQPKDTKTVTYYQPVYTCDVEDVPDWSDVYKYCTENDEYIVDIMNPCWHNDKENFVKGLVEFYTKQKMFDEIMVIE